MACAKANLETGNHYPHGCGKPAPCHLSIPFHSEVIVDRLKEVCL